MGRPPIQVHRHILDITPVTREWLDETIETITNKLLAGRGIAAAGDALQGYLSSFPGATALTVLLGLGIGFTFAEDIKAGTETAARGLLQRLGVLFSDEETPEGKAVEGAAYADFVLTSLRRFLGLP